MNGDGNKGDSRVLLSTSSMIDSVAEWSLSKVIDMFRKKAADQEPFLDHRVHCRSCIRSLEFIVNELCTVYTLTRGQMSRCLTYHGVSILQNEAVLVNAITGYRSVRRLALQRDDPDLADIINNLVPYTPVQLDEVRVSFRVYDSHVMSEIQELAQGCGTTAGQLAQVAMVRSILTCDLPEFQPVANRLQREAERWDRWVRFRSVVVGSAVKQWDSLDGAGKEAYQARVKAGEDPAESSVENPADAT